MKLSASDLSELADLAISAASEAGQMIARSRPGEVQHKLPQQAGTHSLASQVVTDIDRRSEDMIFDILAPSSNASNSACSPRNKTTTAAA